MALEEERVLGYPAGRIFVDSIEQMLATVLVSSYGAISFKKTTVRTGLAPKDLRLVRDFIEANLASDLSLEQIASCVGLSVGHLSSQFRKIMRISPHQYVLQRRIRRAKEMLGHTHLSLSEIGSRVGFGNPQHFTTVFRRIAGVAPSAYRRGL
jgi:AraC family transcriptional regulator